MIVGIGLAVIAVALAAGFAVALSIFKSQSERMADIEGKLGIAVVPFWGHAIKVAAELLIHEGESFQEADDLIAKALLEPSLQMTDGELARLNTLMDLRMVDRGPHMRLGEQEAAGVIKYAIPMARLEAGSKIALSGFTVVGRHEPVAQQQGKEPKLV